MELRQEKREFARLSAQLMVQSMVTALVSAADAIMSGALDQQALSAITLAGQVMQLYSFFLMALCIGSTVLASQYFGINDLESVRKVMNITLRSSVTGGAVFFILALLAPAGIMGFFTDEGELIEIGADYLKLCSPAFLFMSFSQIYMNIMKNTGRAKLSSTFGCIMAGLNIALNYMLIFGRFGFARMGVSGAAVATTVSRGVELILAVISSQKGSVRFSFRGLFRSSRGISRKFWRYTLPSLAQMSSWKLATTCSVAIIGHMGADIVAASSFALIVHNILCSIADGYASACGIRIGRCLGRGDTEKARSAGDRLLGLSLVLAVCVGGIACLCCPALVRAAVMTENAKRYLKIMIFFTGFRVVGKFFNSTLAMGIFSAGGDIAYLQARYHKHVVCDAAARADLGIRAASAADNCLFRRESRRVLQARHHVQKI